MSITRCRFDCYQINLHVTLSEEDSCFFDRYGPSLFNIRKCGCTSNNNCCLPPSPETPTVEGVPVVLPDAVILNIDIDRCDCTKATFNLYVRLPCTVLSTDALQCAINALNDLFTGCTKNCLAAAPGTICVNPATGNSATCGPSTVLAGVFIGNAVQTLIDNANALFVDCDQTVQELVNAIGNLITGIDIILNAITVYNTNSGNKCDLTNLTNLLTALKTELINYSSTVSTSQGSFENQKFCITSGASGHERKIITFDVSPLPKDVVSTGVFTKCYSYEVTRVPCRTPNETAVTNCSVKTGINFVINNEECCNVCAVNTESNFVPDTLRIMFPMTREIKCLIPDFNLSGTFVNVALGTISTKVRLVSCTPSKFFLPAKITFDKLKCMVCLDISASYIMSDAAVKDMEGFEHRFGCSCGNNRHGKCCCDVIDVRAALLAIQQNFITHCIDVSQSGSDNDIALWTALGNVLFQTLARSKKIDVQGVNKCVETNLFSFQVCYVPYRGFCVDLCSCKAKTDLPDFGKITVGSNDYTLNPCNSFKVQADNEYSYEFLKLSTGYVDATLNC